MLTKRIFVVALAATLLAGVSVAVPTAPASALTTHTVTSADGLTSMTVRNENDGTLTYSVAQG